METETKNSFVFFRGFKETVQHLDKEDRAELYDAIIAYGLDSIEPELTKPYLKAIWVGIKIDIDGSNRRYKKAVEDGKKSKGNKTNHPTKEGLTSLDVAKIATKIQEPILKEEPSTPAKGKLITFIKGKGLGIEDETRFLHMIDSDELTTIKEVEVELAYLYQ